MRCHCGCLRSVSLSVVFPIVHTPSQWLLLLRFCLIVVIIVVNSADNSDDMFAATCSYCSFYEDVCVAGVVVVYTTFHSFCAKNIFEKKRFITLTPHRLWQRRPWNGELEGICVVECGRCRATANSNGCCCRYCCNSTLFWLHYFFLLFLYKHWCSSSTTPSPITVVIKMHFNQFSTYIHFCTLFPGDRNVDVAINKNCREKSDVVPFLMSLDTPKISWKVQIKMDGK